MKMNVYYISIEGNTKHFVTKMSQLFHNVSLHRITDQSDFVEFKKPFFCFIPTYVKGTQYDPKHREKFSGENYGYQELDTLTMNDELSYHDNYKNCLGLIASGNRNFGVDCYCWTGKLYHRKYHLPIIADYEIRGNMDEENEINHRMIEAWNKATGDNLKFHEHKEINPRLIKLEKEYHNI